MFTSFSQRRTTLRQHLSQRYRLKNIRCLVSIRIKLVFSQFWGFPFSYSVLVNILNRVFYIHENLDTSISKGFKSGQKKVHEKSKSQGRVGKSHKIFPVRGNLYFFDAFVNVIMFLFGGITVTSTVRTKKYCYLYFDAENCRVCHRMCSLWEVEAMSYSSCF